MVGHDHGVLARATAGAPAVGPAPAAPVPPPITTLANAITLARLCSVPAVVWLVLRAHFGVALWLVAAAGLSDAVDGWLARRHGVTAVGTLLDPVADKVLLVCLYVVLGWAGVLPDWLAILVVFRDALIVGGILVMLVLGQEVTIRPLRVSKLNTALQIALVMLALLLRAYGVTFGHLAPLLPVLVWIVVASTIVSGAAYVWRGVWPNLWPHAGSSVKPGAHGR